MTYDDIERAIALKAPDVLTDASVPKAAVALVLHEGEGQQNILFIERATHQADPWSGNVGFPGGKTEEDDVDERQTAERETFEEVGVALAHARYLGRLSDVGGSYLHVCVSCFVYGLVHNASLQLSNEVKDAFWVPLDALRDPGRHGEAQVRFGDHEFLQPAFRLPQHSKPPLWGLTYRFVLQFLDVIHTVG